MEGRGSATGRVAVVMMVLVMVMVPGALAANHIVGGSALWDIPATNDPTYYDSTWAAGQTFAVGDTLEFKYTVGRHNAVQYNTLAEYNACSGTAVKTYTTGDDTVTLSAAGTYYFICSIPGHCTDGMKVSVTVGATATPPNYDPYSPNYDPCTSSPVHL